jgi:CelD/BcsL family acetyltransferase involved in cellulose biosynthesis
LAALRNILGRLRGALDGPPRGIGRADEVGFEPFESQGLVVHCHTDWPSEISNLKSQIPNLHSAWLSLLSRVPDATTFQSPTWQRAGWIATHPVARLRILTLHRGEELVGVIPLCLTDKRNFVSPSPAVSDYLEPLLLPEAAEPCLRATLAFIAAQWDRTLVEVTFHNVRDSAPLRRILPPIAESAGFACEQVEVEQAPVISLPPTWDQYLDQLDAHERKEMRRKLKKAEEKGHAELVSTPARESLVRLLTWMESVGGEKGDAVKQFVRPLIEAGGAALLSEGRMELLTLHILGQPIASLLQFPARDGPMLYNLGYDDAKRDWSPGVVATAMAIRRAIAQGATTYDLLRGREPFKYRLGGRDRPVYRLTLRKPDASARE